MKSSTRRLQHPFFMASNGVFLCMKYEIPLMLKQGNRRVGKENCLNETGEYLAVEVPQCAVSSTALGQITIGRANACAPIWHGE